MIDGAPATVVSRLRHKSGDYRWFADAWHVDLGIPLELLAVRAAIGALPLLPTDVAPCVDVSPETGATPGSSRRSASTRTG